MSERVVEPAEIRSRIRTYLTDEVILDDAMDLTDATPLLSGLLDSMGLMDLVAFLEDEFGVALEFADVDTTNFRTVGDIAELVSRRAGAA